VVSGANPAPPCTSNGSPFALPQVDPGNSATVNDDGRITWYQRTPTNPASGTDPLIDKQGDGWNPATRELHINNGGTLTLGGGTYNFCSLIADQGAHITIANSGTVRIFIDSPDDPNSKCPTGPDDGVLAINNGASFDSYSGNAAATQIYVYGSNNDSNQVIFDNVSTTNISLYAPQSRVEIGGSKQTTFTGAIAAYFIQIDNVLTFHYYPGDSSLTAGTTGLYYRTAWEQCPATPTNPSDPTSGC
jgi:hypothetical protein